MRNQTAQTIAKVLVNKIFTKYGSPEVVLTDQGTNFLSSLIQEVCKLFKVKQIRTTAYHSQTDGLVERFNRTLCDMLACYVSDQPANWDKYLPFVTFAYNTAKQALRAIQETPLFLLFGREPIMRCIHSSGKKLKNWQENISSNPKQDRKNTTIFSDINYQIQHTENKQLESVVHTNHLKLYIPRKQDTTKEEKILENLPEKVEAQRRPTIHQHRPGRPRKQQLMQTLLFLLCLLHSFNPTYPIYASVFDCNNMKIRGILDFESPYYCDNEKSEAQHLSSIPTAYTLVTKQKPADNWKGWTCRQWTKTKKITGSFWIGSFDTVYSHETILITPLECWRMANVEKCGDNNMQIGPTGLSFTATPTGEGFLEIPRIPESDDTSRLYDTSRQIEISQSGWNPSDVLDVSCRNNKILYEMFKTTLTTCLQNTGLDTSVCNDYRELYKSKTRRWTLQDVQFLFNSPLEDEQLGTRLYSISYAWGTIRLAHRTMAVIEEEGKLV
ncbi:Uncharacterized protein APZ42_033899 [Daphnia magna]|uniref:Integrase catalytic domain-containing protein n=1 Tax=Daphnia magna TaxID=35525 RepID=A0A164KM25_9CRUS|nr:Uncharacterized protein APZ42_033899 [Daphnia magna]